jgi:pseudaminic acid synthase
MEMLSMPMLKDRCAKSTYVIAEMSANHLQSYERAERIVHEMAKAGADAIKLQTYTADKLTLPADNEYFRIKGTVWNGETLHGLYQKSYMPWEWHEKLAAIAGDYGLDCFSTPIDESGVDFLEQMNVPCYKVASFELVDLILLKKIAATGKPVIMSTGMASLGEIEEAVRTLRANGTPEIALLKCVSAYPAPVEETNLLTIPHLAETFDCIAGLSDHSLGPVAPVAAVAIGAQIIEKHFTLCRADGGSDASFSLEPEEFRSMVEAIRVTEKALGRVCYELTDHQRASVAFRRSLFVSADIKAGETFTRDNVRSVRPADGLHTRHYEAVLGRKASRDLKMGTPLAWDHLAAGE